MTYANLTPMIAGAAAARARHVVVSHFRDAGAVSPQSSIAFVADRRMEKSYFEALKREGAIETTGEGRYYLNNGRLAEYERRRRTKGLAIAGGAMVVIIAAVLVFA